METKKNKRRASDSDAILRVMLRHVYSSLQIRRRAAAPFSSSIRTRGRKDVLSPRVSR